jgi:chemotaxis protein methyltransferase CheR
MSDALGDEAFRKLAERLRVFCGHRFGPEQRVIFERRLPARLTLHGLERLDDYVAQLGEMADDRAELEEVLDLVTVNETYFFREDDQLRAFRDRLLPTLVAERRQRPREGRSSVVLWSAGCSTGEEVYSIAMHALDKLGPEPPVRVFGCDISRRCIGFARRGLYGTSSFRSTPADVRRRFFTPEGELFRVNDDVRAFCHFAQMNLLDDDRAPIVGPFAAIFCRNLLIYLDEPARTRVVKGFYDRLQPGGYLLLGHSESLLHGRSPFEAVELGTQLVYRKRAAP